MRPAIVIPEETEESQLNFVLLHEQTHIKDRDAVLKILALFALSVNWFNPLVWFMVKIFERDIERYCDERVLKKIGAEKALFYANTILDFAERESLS
ncbi:MAG: M56 family metallopeptidase, partial [Oscillospiraceae bacterium]|nr:M56 family metallopeptidase [Oscillospiraceae bacterium]